MKDINAGTPSADADAVSAEALLSELDLGDIETTEVVEELNDTELEAVEIVSAKHDAYTAAPETPIVEATSEASAEASEEAPAKTKREKKPRIARDLNTLDPALFVLHSSVPVVDLEANRAGVIATRPTQKKIAEKFDNLFQAIASGRKPSVYTMACFEVLERTGTATATDFVNALKATDSKRGSTYNVGTARSQAGQIMVLFSTVGIATRSKQTLTYNKDSVIGAKLKSLLAEPLPAAA